MNGQFIRKVIQTSGKHFHLKLKMRIQVKTGYNFSPNW